MKRKVISFLIFFFNLIFAFGQGDSNNWYFGFNAGIHFNIDGSVEALTDGQLNSYEGCASISTKEGDLLFYTDGETIYDRQHNIMQNGENLFGLASSTQSAIIIPLPESPNLYYVITANAKVVGVPGNGLNYSVVDISMNNGNGAVTLKNIRLLDDTSEKIAGVIKDCTSNSIWVVALGSDNGGLRPFNTYYAFEINPTGIILPPVSSLVNEFTDNRGYLKFSLDGKKLVNADMTSGLYLYDFNLETGLVTNGQEIIINAVNDTNAYGVEFSPDANYLYVHASNDVAWNLPQTASLFQYNLQAANISASQLTLDDSRILYRAALQLGPNGKIYRSLTEAYDKGSPFLGVINNPNEPGLAANYEHNAVPLNGGLAAQGFPSLLQSFNTSIDFTSENVEITQNNFSFCVGDVFELKASFLPGATYQWSKEGAILVGETNSTLEIANVAIEDAGDYEVTVIRPGAELCPLMSEISVAINPVPIVSPLTLSACDTDLNDDDGLASFDFSNLGLNDITAYSFYETEENLNNDIPITDINNYRNTTAFNQTIYFKYTNANGCSASSEIILTVLEKPESVSIGLEEEYELYANGVTITLEDIFNAFSWYKIEATGETLISNTTTVDINEIGDYRLEVNSFYYSGNPLNACTFNYNFTVIEGTDPIQGDVIIDRPDNGLISFCSEDDILIEAVFVEGFEYQWLKDNIGLVGETQNTLRSTNVNAMFAGEYTVRVTDPDGNFDTEEQSITVQIEELPIIQNLSLEVCDLDFDGVEDGLSIFNFNELAITDLQNYTFYESLSNMENEIEIDNPLNYRNTVAFNQKIYFKYSVENGCSAIGELDLSVSRKPQIALSDAYYLCLNSEGISIEINEPFESYLWYRIEDNNEELVSSESTITINALGNYELRLQNLEPNETGANTCLYTYSFSVLENLETINGEIILGQAEGNLRSYCQGSNFVIEAISSPNYSYQWFKDGNLLIGENQESITVEDFDILQSGLYSVLVEDIDNISCAVEADISIALEPDTIIEDLNYETFENDGGEFLAGTAVFNLENFSFDNEGVYSFYETLDDLLNDEKISTPTAFINSTPYSQTIFYTYTNLGGCTTSASINLFVNLYPNFGLENTYYICSNEEILTLNVEEQFENPNWYRINQTEEILLSQTNNLEIYEAGLYRFKALGSTIENTFVETILFDFQVLENESPLVDNVTVNGENMIIVDLNDLDNYEFSINGGPFQNANVFKEVAQGLNFVWVREIGGCAITEIKVDTSVNFIKMGFPKFFTPNGDGINDFWQYRQDETNVILENVVLSIEIYNRMGQLIHQLDSSSIGWNGNYNGASLPSDDYWFKASLINNQMVQGHFSLKR